MSAAILLFVAVGTAASGIAIAPPPPGLRAAPKPVAVLPHGVVWVDQGRVLFQGFRSGPVTLGGVTSGGIPMLAASGGAVALVGAEAGFAAGSPPRRLRSVEAPHDEEVREFAGGGCPVWSPLAGSTGARSSDFAVADGELVDAGECQAEYGYAEEQSRVTSQPLFIHRLHGGGWRVLRWMTGDRAPVLATEGNLLAIGEPLSEVRMRVTIVDLASRRLVARFGAARGELSFASRHRLVLSVPEFAGAAASSRTAAAEAPSRIPVRRASYGLQLYALDGTLLAYIGTSEAPAQASRMRLLVQEDVEGDQVLAVRNILDGTSRQLIGFNGRARTLEGVAFRWPAVALIETTSVPLAQSEVTCSSGEYHAASPPRLRIIDLTRLDYYLPPPPSAHLEPPAGLCTRVVAPR